MVSNRFTLLSMSAPQSKRRASLVMMLGAPAASLTAMIGQDRPEPSLRQSVFQSLLQSHKV